MTISETDQSGLAATPAADRTTADPWRKLVGQHEARERLEVSAIQPVHAYLFVGTLGSGSMPAAFGFAGLILAGPTHNERDIRLSVDGIHPDLVVIEPEGATLRVTEAEQIIQAGLRSPIEGSRKVIVVKGVDAIEEAAVGKLLKVIEEPPASTVFVLLAEVVSPELVTIASRCVRVDFGPVSSQEISRALQARGVEPERAEAAAVASGGDVGRAELLAGDNSLVIRAQMWAEVPTRLDGTGSTTVALVNELRAGMDGAQEALETRHGEEIAALELRVEQTGERGSGRSHLVARHKREIRRQRTDELRFGLSILARKYRDRLLECPDPAAETAIRLIQDAARNMNRNPNEALQLQALLTGLNGARR